MTIIQLPTQLPGVLNLSAVNQQLKAHAAQLDWSAVVNPEGSQLAQLLAGLDLSDHAESLGLETILSDDLVNAVMAYFDQAEEPPGHPRKKPPHRIVCSRQKFGSSRGCLGLSRYSCRSLKPLNQQI